MSMKIAAAALLLSSLSGRALAAADPYAALKPLIGTWLVDKDCVVSREKMLVVIMRQPKQVFVAFRNPIHPDAVLGTASITYNGVGDHYRVSAQMADNPILKSPGLRALPGSLVVSDDADD